MVSQAVRKVVAEAARKPKEVPSRSEESIMAQRDRHVRGLPGYAHGDLPLDMSTPLGKKSRTKRQGASGIGNWTTESKRMSEEAIKKLVEMIVAEEIKVVRGR